MKKLIYIALSFCLIFAGTSTQAADGKTKELTEQQKLRVEQMTQRVEEIKKLDRSDLSDSEKQDLKTELQDMKKEAKAVSNGGVYLSVGVLLVIIIVLLLLT
jgi:cytochrome c-type biogenesis protein CcmH/NrfG